MLVIAEALVYENTVDFVYLVGDFSQLKQLLPGHSRGRVICQPAFHIALGGIRHCKPLLTGLGKFGKLLGMTRFFRGERQEHRHIRLLQGMLLPAQHFDERSYGITLVSNACNRIENSVIQFILICCESGRGQYQVIRQPLCPR